MNKLFTRKVRDHSSPSGVVTSSAADALGAHHEPSDTYRNDHNYVPSPAPQMSGASDGRRPSANRDPRRPSSGRTPTPPYNQHAANVVSHDDYRGYSGSSKHSAALPPDASSQSGRSSRREARVQDGGSQGERRERSSSKRRVSYQHEPQHYPPQAQGPDNYADQTTRQHANHEQHHSSSATHQPQGQPDVGRDNNSSNRSAATASSSAVSRRPAYLLHRDLVIGKGSYGQVCIASRGEAEGVAGKHGGKRKKFACKCVMLRSDPKYIAKLQEEVNVLRELRGHENVIRLYDVFCVDNELFIITELGRGGDLFHLLTTHPKHGVTEAYAAKTVAQMLSAVAFLHHRHICHRDLKLENWVLESGKDVWSPLKLIDFGLSTHFTPGHKLSRVVGSSYYVAPEVLKKTYTESCDLWSLGVIVYMLLSGAPPFYGKTDEAIKASIVNGEYTFPHELFRDVSDEAMAFVSTLLSYNTEYRYTAEQALTHPWLAANLDPDQLQRAKDGARGAHLDPNENGDSRPEPMQL